MSTFFSKLKIPVIFLLATVILAGLIKGTWGNSLTTFKGLSNQGQVFESSQARSRYALTENIVENGQFILPRELAEYATPDLGMYQDRYISIFPPGTSLFLIPFYVLGIPFNLSQVFTSIAIALLAVANCYLIYSLVRKLGLPAVYGILSSVIFLFASNALVYATTITQHHLSTFILLLSLIISWGKPSFFKHGAIWFLYGCGLLVDWPNLVLMLPIILHVMFTEIVVIENEASQISLTLHYVKLLTVIFIAIPISFYLYYNLQTTGEAFAFGQQVQRVRYFDGTTPIVGESKNGSLISPFSYERMPQGIYTVLFGKERGAFVYFPVFLLFFLGTRPLLMQNKNQAFVLLGILTSNILLYSMFSDVWGGWAFGPRYLIPSFAIASIFIAFAMRTFGHQFLFSLTFSALSTMSICMSVLGALTTTLIPPFREATGLGIDYTININIDYLLSKKLASIVYNNIFSGTISNGIYYLTIVGAILTLVMGVQFRSNRRQSSFDAQKL